METGLRECWAKLAINLTFLILNINPICYELENCRPATVTHWSEMNELQPIFILWFSSQCTSIGKYFELFSFRGRLLMMLSWGYSRSNWFMTSLTYSVSWFLHHSCFIIWRTIWKLPNYFFCLYCCFFAFHYGSRVKLDSCFYVVYNDVTTVLA